LYILNIIVNLYSMSVQHKRDLFASVFLQANGQIEH